MFRLIEGIKTVHGNNVNLGIVAPARHRRVGIELAQEAAAVGRHDAWLTLATVHCPQSTADDMRQVDDATGSPSERRSDEAGSLSEG